MSKRIKIVIWVVFVSFLGVVLWSNLAGQHISTDLSIIGQGKPVVVLVHESHMPGGMEAMALINRIRGDFEDAIEFRVASLGRPEGQAFANNFDAFDGVVVLLKAQGEVHRVLVFPDSEAAARDLLQELKTL